MQSTPQPLVGARLLLACLLVAILEGFDIVAISIAAPALARAFDLSPAQIGAIFAAARPAW